ncbi:SDR family oxidoreductase [Novosphingobium sp. MMS21-SN21R]|uniref:SDR family NAD(P)-dependent oxidoreductase n=1 Tax=Novosphingobium sp. MMS21-SN21R TaxID=2969298 RepID=UPI00288821B3|nr:SDR family oxidoreductase [Novosphingobium sp. MMS21-SN21R]MDT0509807.1 SDR family oxidoreductase [Novosphingobium sp. MMS21-SN21R]
MAEQEFGGKIVIVTGAASGLGRATARAFAAAGAMLVLADRDASGLDATRAELEAAGNTVTAVPTDISDAGACLALGPAAIAAFGRIDVVCNVAGAFRFDHASQITPDVWDMIHSVNVRGPFFIIQGAMPHLLESAGTVVNVASASAFLGHAYLTHYASSKAALVNMTKSLAMEYMQSPVRINAIAPGGINTAMTATPSIPDGIDFQLLARYSPLRGSSEPEDLTDLILMLAGPRGKSIHGACINADRGITAG